MISLIDDIFPFVTYVNATVNILIKIAFMNVIYSFFQAFSISNKNVYNMIQSFDSSWINTDNKH